ncbi:MAG: cystathionine beta-lyase [Pseudomonadota bacterium]|nr:cystathionine beta-lyase [Pseudomonadota bacterium]MDE3037981.1 cystathionine beta-lyase [Pseudomonadota bacterium]
MRPETLLSTLGCMPDEHRGAVNTPVYRASTILFPTLAEFEAADRGEAPYATYGRYGTVLTDALENTIATLEGADHAIALSSGLAAITLSLLTFLKSGDHLLMVDTVYGPARRFCDHELKRFGVETTYYDPAAGAGISALIKENTRVVYVESPGSLTFEVQDIPAIAKAAHAKNCLVIGDNTWATPLYIRPFDLGMDISIHSATKYISGHSDLVMGTVSCREKHYKPLLRTFRNTGGCPGGDNCYLALRGIRSMAARLAQQSGNGLKVAEWLKKRPEVAAVLHPALPGAPGHDLWKRDFTGACSLFAFVLQQEAPPAGLAALFDGLELFGMGYSWGGFESLLIPLDLQNIRTVTDWPYAGRALRIHIGLEHPDDLIADLEAGFKRLKKT